MTKTNVGCAALVGLLSGLLPASAGEIARPGHWIGKRGTERTTLAVAADEGYGLLLIRCARGQVAVSVDWARYIGSQPIAVTTRVAGAEASMSDWPLSANLRETVYPGDGAAYMRVLLSGSRLFAQLKAAVPVNLLPQTTSVDDVIAGRGARIDPPVPLAPETLVEVSFDLTGLKTVTKAEGAECQVP
jgi:hypothetical protein